MKTTVRLLSSLEKVFLDEECAAQERTEGSMLSGEIYSFQLAYTTYGEGNYKAGVKVDSPLKQFITVYEVGYVPSEMPVPCRRDGDYLKTKPGLFPDVLSRCESEIDVMSGQWRSLWLTVEPGDGVPAGKYPIRLTVSGGGEDVQAVFTLEIVGMPLPEQRLIYTDWFHCDCLANYYRTKVFSEKHWKLIGNYMAEAAKYGMNMILTPVFTPPLDTQIGGERPTVQLVGVSAADGKYGFDFEKLGRWIALARKCGIRYFEFSHLFTQWGARSAPKIMATDNGVRRRIFGWETDAGSPEYRRFLECFLRELREFLLRENVYPDCYFHISDEPSAQDMEHYGKCMELVSRNLPGAKIIDALSSYDFYRKGIVKKPIPSSDHIDVFIRNGVKNLWTYYCCVQGTGVSNRFMAMPSARNRALGLPLYKFDLEGFLHWGFNFWNSRYSLRSIDPYRVTDSLRAFPSGDAFVVYPGRNGPVPSLRQLVFHEGLQDLRALRLLESLSSRGEALRLMEEDLAEPVTFASYPRSSSALLDIRRRVNCRIGELSGGR